MRFRSTLRTFFIPPFPLRSVSSSSSFSFFLAFALNLLLVRWEMALDGEGNPYYIDHVNRRTQREKPHNDSSHSSSQSSDHHVLDINEQPGQARPPSVTSVTSWESLSSLISSVSSMSISSVCIENSLQHTTRRLKKHFFLNNLSY